MTDATTRVKLCGLRGSDDARAAVLAGADLVGIVLVPGTRRYVPPPTAAAMVRTVRASAADQGRFAPEVVGVLGPMSLAVAMQLVVTVGLDAVQLVGDDVDCEPLADALAGTPLIRSIPVCADADLAAVRAQVAAWEARGARIVYDAAVEGQLGGTGLRIPTALLEPVLVRGRHGLAGGLDPDNVAEAVRSLGPAVVDVSSGIESRAGHKDPVLMQAFVAAVRATSLDATAASVPDALAPAAGRGVEQAS